MPKFSPGETVWVSSTHLPGTRPYALMEREVLDVADRPVIVDDRRGGLVKVSTRTAHSPSLGFLVLRVGDLSTKLTLFDPLAKNVLQYLSLLINESQVRMLHVRTDAEVRAFMSTDGAAYGHVILIAHGTPKSVLALGKALSGAEVGSMLNGGDPKVVRAQARLARRGTAGQSVNSATGSSWTNQVEQWFAFLTDHNTSRRAICCTPSVAGASG
jgi:hypothetical protein